MLFAEDSWLLFLPNDHSSPRLSRKAYWIFFGSTRVNPGQPIKPGLFKGNVRLKIRNGEGRQWSGIHVAVMVSLVFMQRKGSSHHHLLTNFIYLLWLHHRQPTCLSFFNHLFCAGMNKICWKPRSRVLAHVASLSPETVSLVHPPTRRPRPANEEETGERRASFASSNRSLQKEKQNSWPAPRLDETG